MDTSVIQGRGVYRAEIGPSITGENRYLDCQGVNSIAGSLRKPSLKEVNRELRGTGFLDQNTPLPRHAAGGDVGVLVGIQDVQLDPVLIAVLPSGTGLYRCPFIDIWGSQIAFAGPHPSFTTSHCQQLSLTLQLFKKGCKILKQRECQNTTSDVNCTVGEPKQCTVGEPKQCTVYTVQ